MTDAFLLRLSPRYVRSGRTRGTLIDPAAAGSSQWDSDQQSYYRSTVGSAVTPQEPVTVEFGQPPIELAYGATGAVGGLMILVMGAESSQGSNNDRGLLGVGRISGIQPTNSAQGASARVAVQLVDLVFATPIITTAVMLRSTFLPESGLRQQKIFGWDGSPSAQNCVPLHNRRGSDDNERFAPVLATLALMRDEDAVFWSSFKRLYPDFASSVEALPLPQVSPSDSVTYVPPEYQSEPIDSTRVATYLSAKGMSLHPWQIATYLAAVRTKPFVILAGMSGTGKTSLPRFVAEGTGAEIEIVSVRPDWTDSSDLLGYTNISGDFVPGPLSRLAASAMLNPDVQYFFLLDEMNIARTEYYLAEVLSCIERRDPDGNSAPLIPNAGVHSGVDYSEVVIPRNLAIIGSVNVDESTFDFSKKVLDRAFVIEFSDIDLRAHQIPAEDAASYRTFYSALSWRSAEYGMNEADPIDTRAILDSLIAINEIMAQSRLGVGYRVRDEFLRFISEAAQVGDGFYSASAERIAPLDVAILTKLLPRIQGTGLRMDSMLFALQERLLSLDCTQSARQVGLMLERLRSDGFTSFF